MPDTGETFLELDLTALEHNYSYLRAAIRPETRFLAVVKAYAYGSDSEIIALKLQELGVDYFAVAYVAEGVRLRDAGIEKPILVLHPQPANFDTLIARCLEPSLYSARILNAFIAAATKLNQQDYPVHIKFNTGLNRLGFWENDVAYIGRQLQATKAVKVLSVFSHLAASEDPAQRDFSLKQIADFEKIAAACDRIIDPSPFRHMLNTSGILNYPEAQYQMVRSGIGLYGYGNHPEVDSQLKPVATLKSVISQIHKIEPHESVGYNRAYTADKYQTIATLPLGHADGIGRHFGNGRSHVMVNGQPAAVVGNVCMDMIMVDVTDIPCKEGDEVIVFGQGHSAEVFAAGGGTISYELITGISQRVRRVLRSS